MRYSNGFVRGAAAGVLMFALLAGPCPTWGQALGNETSVGPSAQTTAPDLNNVGIDQKLNAQLPLDLPFRDETGSAVTLRKYFNHRKPVILSLVYFNCPMLCPEVLSGMTHTLRLVTFNIGKDYDVLTVSFDPRDTPQSAAREKAEQLQALGKPGAEEGWHFLTGSEDSIQKLTRAVGFRYKWDARSQQFNHATAIMILTPEGKVSKYFYGVEYKPADMRFGLIQASNHRIGTVVDQVLLFCCQYNPTTGKYDLLVSRLLSVAGAITVLVLGSFLFVMFKIKPKARKQSQRSRAAGSSS